MSGSSNAYIKLIVIAAKAVEEQMPVDLRMFRQYCSRGSFIDVEITEQRR